MKFEQILKIKTDSVFEADTEHYRIIAMTKHLTPTVLNITLEYYRFNCDEAVQVMTITPNTVMKAPYFTDVREAEWEYIC